MVDRTPKRSSVNYKDVQRAFLMGGVEEVEPLQASKESILRAAREFKARGIDVTPLEALAGRKVRGRLVTDDGELVVTRKVQQQKTGGPFLHVDAEAAGFEKGEEVRIRTVEGRIVVERLS